MQTLWDHLQQVVRILVYLGAGALVQRGWIDEQTSIALAGAVLALLTALWTWWWNRRVATVAGLEKAGASAAAATVASALRR